MYWESKSTKPVPRIVVEFGEWLWQELIKVVPHRHVVCNIPNVLRRYFIYDNKLLSELSSTSSM